MAARLIIAFGKEHNVRVGFFERDQFLAVLAHLPAPVRPATTFAYITGWRIDSEVFPLEWRQIEFGAGEVRLDPGKTKNGEGRTLYRHRGRCGPAMNGIDDRPIHVRT